MHVNRVTLVGSRRWDGFLGRLSCGYSTPGRPLPVPQTPLPKTYHPMALQWSYLTERASISTKQTGPQVSAVPIFLLLASESHVEPPQCLWESAAPQDRRLRPCPAPTADPAGDRVKRPPARPRRRALLIGAPGNSPPSRHAANGLCCDPDGLPGVSPAQRANIPRSHPTSTASLLLSAHIGGRSRERDTTQPGNATGAVIDGRLLIHESCDRCITDV